MAKHADRSGRARSGNPVGRGTRRPGRSRRRSLGRAHGWSRAATATTRQLPEALPPDGAPYPLILRGPSYVWWRSVLGVVCGLSLYLLMTAVVTQVVLGWPGSGRAGDGVRGLRPSCSRLRAPGRDARGQPRHRHPDPHLLGADGDRPPGAAALAELGAAPDPVALPADLPGDRPGGAQRGDAASRWRSGRRRRWLRSPASGPSSWSSCSPPRSRRRRRRSSSAAT